jgi:TonB family protein
LVFLAVAVIFWPQNVAGQQPAVPKLTLAQVEQLVSNHVPDSTLSTQIQRRGLAFTPNPALIESLRAKGAGPLTLAAIEASASKTPPQAASSVPTSAVPPEPNPVSERSQASRKVDIASWLAERMLVQKTKPPYPPNAGAARVSGTVELRATVSETGAVEELDVVSGPAMLRQAALDAVETWRYQPYLINNMPVKFDTRVIVVFSTDGDGSSMLATWSDPATGLMWTKEDNGSDVNWGQANSYCYNLQRLGGYSGWRLATIDELLGIYDPNVSIQVILGNGPTANFHVKGNLKLSGWWVWSGSQYNPGTARGFSFNDGLPSDFRLGYSNFGRALCVRRSGDW